MGELVCLPGVTALPDGGGVLVTEGQEVEEIPDLEQGLHIVLKCLVSHTCTSEKNVSKIYLLFLILAYFHQNKQINMIRVLAFFLAIYLHPNYWYHLLIIQYVSLHSISSLLSMTYYLLICIYMYQFDKTSNHSIFVPW